MQHLPEVVENDILPFIGEEKTEKQTIINRMIDYNWHRSNVYKLIDTIKRIPCRYFYKGEDGHIRFDNFSIE